MSLEMLKTVFPGKPPKYAGPGDLSGKVVIVTGGNAGIGYELCKSLLANNAKVYLAARTPTKAHQAIESLKEASGKENIHFLHLDLGSLTSVNHAAAEFLAKENHLHILLNNAGLMTSKPGEKTVDGYETQFATNVLGHHVFTHALIPVLEKTAKESESGTVRVISTGSLAHKMADKNELEFDELDTGGWKQSFPLYCRSKLGNSIWTHAMNKHHKDKGILAYTVHPGIVTSETFNGMSLYNRILGKIAGYPPSDGAITILWAATAAPEEDVGSFYIPWMAKFAETEAATNPEYADLLWEWLEERRLKKADTGSSVDPLA